jgi:hypothetical protein
MKIPASRKRKISGTCCQRRPAARRQPTTRRLSKRMASTAPTEASLASNEEKYGQGNKNNCWRWHCRSTHAGNQSQRSRVGPSTSTAPARGLGPVVPGSASSASRQCEKPVGKIQRARGKMSMEAGNGLGHSTDVGEHWGRKSSWGRRRNTGIEQRNTGACC